METSAFDPNSQHFDVGWTAQRAPAVSEDETEELLSAYVSQDFYLPFFRVFGPLAREAEKWNMLNLAMLQNFEAGLQRFKHLFYQHWIHTVKLTVTQRVPDEPEPLWALVFTDRGHVDGVQLIGEVFPSVLDRHMQNSLALNDHQPCLTRDGPQHMERVRRMFQNLAAFDMKRKGDVKVSEIFKAATACRDSIDNRTATVCLSDKAILSISLLRGLWKTVVSWRHRAATY